MSIASTIILVRVCAAHRDPTIIRENASMMKRTHATLAHLSTNVRSVTPSRLGAVAVNVHFTRSGHRAAPESGLVVLTRLELVAPSIPATHINRAV